MQEPRRVEVIIPPRTLFTVAVFGGLVALAVVSLGTLLSIFVAAVLALGLDPVVSALVRRGWKRGHGGARGVRGAVRRRLRDRAGHRRPGVGPDRRVRRRAARLLGRADADATASSRSSRPRGADDTIRNGAQGPRRGAARRGEHAARRRRAACSARVLSLVTLTFLALFLLMERPTITDWLFGFAPPEVERRWRPVLEDSIRAVSSSLIGNVAISVVAGDGRRACRRGRSGCRSRSCSP